MEQAEKKPRKQRSDKGKTRALRADKILPVPPLFTSAPEPEAPIHVRLRLKNYPEAVEFGCAEHTVENGFHVFMYPSWRDRYRTTRREFAISEIIEVEITEARRAYATQDTIAYRPDSPAPTMVPTTRGPQIHSVREAAQMNRRPSLIEQLESSKGPIKMDALPNLTFGDSAG